MLMAAIAFVANTNVLDLVLFKSEIEGTFINNATVTVTVTDTDDVAIAGATWPLAMPYIAASSGTYRAILSDTLPLVPKTSYIAHITASGGTDRIGRWSFVFKPLTRTGLET
jgi:hypothetical protein